MTGALAGLGLLMLLLVGLAVGISFSCLLSYDTKREFLIVLLSAQRVPRVGCRSGGCHRGSCRKSAHRWFVKPDGSIHHNNSALGLVYIFFRNTVSTSQLLSKMESFFLVWLGSFTFAPQGTENGGKWCFFVLFCWASRTNILYFSILSVFFSIFRFFDW